MTEPHSAIATTVRVPACVAVQYLGPSKGFGVTCKQDVKAGDVVFEEWPQVCVQPNSPLVTACANGRCMRVIGPLDALVSRSHALFSSVSKLPVHPTQSQMDQMQQLQHRLAQLPAPLACRNAAQGCSFVFCGAACESAAWTAEHSLMCPGAHAAMRTFHEERNVCRNPDAQVAGKLFSQFISCVARESAKSTGKATVPAERAAEIFKSVTNFHMAPWSCVLAVQAVTAQHGKSPDVEVIRSHLARVCPSKTDSKNDASRKPRPLSDALDQAQKQYRLALAGAVESFLTAAEQCCDRHVFELCKPHLTLENFDLLCGANRLNCTSTQTALPVPKADSGKESGDTPALIKALADVFTPMPLPTAEGRGLFVLHSKMNHSCVANARVENSVIPEDGSVWEDSVLWSARTRKDLANKSHTEPTAKKKKKKKKKKSKGAKQLEAVRADDDTDVEDSEADPQLQRDQSLDDLETNGERKSEVSALKASIDTTAAATSKFDLPACMTNRIVVRAMTDIRKGEEITISYLPQTQELREAAARRSYLLQNYLFWCECKTCVANLPLL